MCITLLRSLLVVVVLGLFVSSVTGSSITIDTFNDDPGVSGYPQHAGIFGTGSEGDFISGLNPAETIFANRGVAVFSAQPAGGYGSADIIVAGGPLGKLGLGTNTVVSPYTAGWRVYWSAPGHPGHPDEIVDLIDDDGTPNTGFRVDFLSAEYDCNIVLTVSQPGLTQPPMAWTPDILVTASPNPQSVFVPFTQFTNRQGTDPFDWTNVYAIKMEIYGAPDGDYEIDTVTVGVPEPASITLMAAGVGLLVRRRRRWR